MRTLFVVDVAIWALVFAYKGFQLDRDCLGFRGEYQDGVSTVRTILPAAECHHYADDEHADDLSSRKSGGAD